MIERIDMPVDSAFRICDEVDELDAVYGKRSLPRLTPNVVRHHRLCGRTLLSHDEHPSRPFSAVLCLPCALLLYCSLASD